MVKYKYNNRQQSKGYTMRLINVVLGRKSVNPYFCGYFGENGCSFGPFDADRLIEKMNATDKDCLITGIHYISGIDADTGQHVIIERQ